MKNNFQPFYASPLQDQLLDRMLAQASSGTVGVFDLDSCLFDPRQRQIIIFREFASLYDWDDLYFIQIEHFAGWDLRQTMRNSGIVDEVIEKWWHKFETFWYERFFFSPYVGFDHPLPGAACFVRECYTKGMKIAYLTGRHQDTAKQTTAAFKRYGFPHDGNNAVLFAKPLLKMNDAIFKRDALTQIAKMGTPVLFLDNEPQNINIFADEYPHAMSVFVDTDHSPRAIKPYSHLPTIKSFWRTYKAGS